MCVSNTSQSRLKDLCKHIISISKSCNSRSCLYSSVLSQLQPSWTERTACSMVGCESSASHRIHPCGSHETCNAAISRAMCKVNYANCLMQAAWLCIQALALPFRVDIPRALLRCDKTAPCCACYPKELGAWDSAVRCRVRFNLTTFGYFQGSICIIWIHMIPVVRGEPVWLGKFQASRSFTPETLYIIPCLLHQKPLTTPENLYTRRSLHQ